MSLKSVKTLTASQIAKKWKLSQKTVNSLIDDGSKIEHEHDKSMKNAKEIARDHISERPDYYKKLRKMEKTKISMKEGMSTEPERDSETIGDYTGASRKVMKVDEVRLPKVSKNVKNKLGKAGRIGATFATVMSGATAYDNASRNVGSPIKDVASVATGIPGKVGWAITPGSATINLANYIKSRKQAKKMEEQGSPANPARYTERPMYEGDAMKDAEDKIKAAFTADKVKDMFKRVDKQRDKDPKWVAYKKRKEHIKEMVASAFAAQKPSSNIIDKRAGLSSQGISNAVNTFKQNMAMRQSGFAREPQVGGSYIPKQSPVASAVGAAGDAVRNIGQSYRDKLGLDLDRSNAIDTAKKVATTAVKSAFPVSSAIASTVANKMSSAPKSTTIDPSTLPVSKASPASIPTVGGSTPPSIERSVTTPSSGSTPTTPRGPAAPATPQSASREGGLDIDQMTQDQSTKTPTDDDVKFNQQMKKRGLDESQIDELSAELVGKVSNARFWQGKAPSETLSRAINKKFIESGKKKEEPKKPLKEGSVELGPLRTHSFSYKDASGKDKEPGSPESPGDVKKVHSGSYGERKVPGGKETEYVGDDIESTTTKPDTGDGTGWSGYVKSKTDVETSSSRSKTTTEPEKKEPWSRTGNEKLSDLVSEKTTMDTKDLINEALDDILENNLVSMKENLMTALQEKAMEKIEEKKKDIAANYFAQ